MRVRSFTAAALVATGCLEVPTGPKPMCASNDDCNRSAGEVCDEGVCWGNPPMGSFSATLGPPAGRADLVEAEIPLLHIPDFGLLDGLALEAPVTISGRVEAYCPAGSPGCDQRSIGATIYVSRPSLFLGGPGFRTIGQSKAGVPRGADSFSLSLPRTRDGDPAYTITVVPDGRGQTPPTTSSAVEIAPPLRASLVASDNLDGMTYMLGGADSPVISGQLPDLHIGYRVVAKGRWDASSDPTEVSTIDYTTTGSYSIMLSDGIVGQVELVAEPYESNVVAPTLELGNVMPIAQIRPITQPGGVGNRLALTIPIEGLSGNGEVKPVSGAVVTVAASYTPPLNGGASAVVSAQATTGDDGLAHVMLLDGPAFATTYKLRVVPPASSSLGVLFDVPFALDQTTAVRLPQRIALHGRVLDAAGEPLGDVSVTAQPALRFKWSLDGDPLAFLDAIPAATSITPATGDFVVWVDPLVADVWGHYDLDFETPTGSISPSWTQSDIEIPRVLGQTTFDLGDVTLPPAAHVHGRITDPGGTVVQGADLRIFQIMTDTSLCTQVADPPDQCQIPAQLVGSGTSDDQGWVRLTLPRP